MTELSKVDLIANQLERQQTDPSITDRSIMDLVGLRRSQFYNIKPKATAELAKRLQDQAAIAQEKLKAAITHAKNGLKSREERLQELQTQAADLIKEIEAAKDVKYVIINDQAQKIATEMSATTKAYLRRTLLAIQAEIAKIEGDYSPEKREMDVNFKTPLALQAIIPAQPAQLDYDSLPTEILEQLLEIARLRKLTEDQT